MVLSTYACDEEIYKALQFGAMGYLSKSVQREELMQAHPQGGQRPPSHHAGSGGAARRRHVAVASVDARTRRAAPAGRRQAQPRDRDALDITEGTVKLHVSSILGKLAVATGPRR